ncbi:unnamed protein product [Lactuca saligna]|uniref:Uncharacterized protein n=1 Tax=Lactuca saligna TaxID=75948 RepID=A0AA35ZNE5_LACSI|nr:unnamed protein product [Lactuca saligna]
MLVVHSSVTHERLDQISTKYHLVEEDRVVLPSSMVVIDCLPSSIVGFYLYYFEFPYRKGFHTLGIIIDQKPDMTPDLSQDIDKICRLNVMMKKFPTAVLGQADGSQLLFLLSEFVEGKILALNLGSDDFNLPILDENFDGSWTEGSINKESESLFRVHELYDDDTGEKTLNVITILLLFFGMMVKVKVENRRLFFVRGVGIQNCFYSSCDCSICWRG